MSKQIKTSGNFVVRINDINSAAFERLCDAKQFVKTKVSEAIHNLSPLDAEINNQIDEKCELSVSVDPSDHEE